MTIGSIDFSGLVIPDLRGKRVLVTGGSSGIGRAVALGFAGQGCRVAIHYYVSAEEAVQVQAAALALGAEAVVLLGGDLSKPGVAKDVVERAAGELGGLDVVINNAGRMGTRTPAAALSEERFAEVMDLNARGGLMVCAAAIPHLCASRGNIISTSSIGARRGSGGIGTVLYASSKGFLTTMTRSLARELAPDRIRVNAVAPGLVPTQFHAMTADRLADLGRSVPLGRFASADECVGAYLFLASSMLSGHITGQVIDVNGGELMA